MFAEVMREQFFDPMKQLGYDYKAISDRLRPQGEGFSGTTLSRIANGQRVPELETLKAILGLVEELAGNPLTEPVRNHVLQVYFDAFAVKQPRLAREYRLAHQVEQTQAQTDHVRRAERTSRISAESEESQRADEEIGDEHELGDDHPAVQVHNESVRLAEDVAEAGVPLVDELSFIPDTPSDGWHRSTLEAILDRTDQILIVLRESLRRDIVRLEAAERRSEDDSTLVVPTSEAPDSALSATPSRSWAGPLVAMACVAALVLSVVLLRQWLTDKERGEGVGGGTPTSSATENPGGNRGQSNDPSSGASQSGGNSGGNDRPQPSKSSGSTGKPPPTPTLDPPTTAPETSLSAETFSRDAPQHISPADNTLFTHFPRTTTLTWEEKPGATSYRYEVECMCPDVWVTGFSDTTTSTSFTFDWYGDQEGRWHVTAIAEDGTESDTSNWSHFNYKTSSQAPSG
ncbi:hypothetical protein OHS70_38405 (plasmid) [Streptomyces sp. NBC_00390]|uniref:helix-turn-helix domain-containing protein n=1 Tax=Streptomyces sp. NBC_00390 TaxID=2975736 RepID=UPI002E1B53C8